MFSLSPSLISTSITIANMTKLTQTHEDELQLSEEVVIEDMVNNHPTTTTHSNQQIFTKVIMTTGGQQLLITSPVKQGVTTRSNESNSNQEKQLIGLLPISPAKQTTTNKTTPTLRSKPANITIQSPSKPADKQQQPHYQIIRLVSATGSTSNTTNSTITTTALKQITGTQAGQQKVLIPASALKGLNASQLLNQTANSSGTQQFLMYTAPTQLIKQSPVSTPNTSKQVTFSANTSSVIASGVSTRQSYVPILPNPSTVLNNSTASTSNKSTTPKSIQNGPKGAAASTEDPPHQLATAANASTGAPSNRPRKPCNCTRSQCLKLYCDCFANGEFCSNCNCINCFNNLDHEENRQKAIKQCLERNPHAFHPKIGKGKTTAQEGIERRHTKGCNCRRSGCLKNYCECYEAKILCTDLCKCCACKNYEDSYERKSLMHLVDAVDIRSSLHGNASGANFVGKENDPLWSNEFRPKLPVPFIASRLQSCSFITNDLVDATTQCLIAQAEKSQKLGLSNEEAERAIIEEFGSCLGQIIDAASKQKDKRGE